MEEISHIKIAQRVEGRCRADVLIELLDLTGLNEDGVEAFFEQWIKKFPERLARPQPVENAEPMTRTEANNFAGHTYMPRGEYRGSAVCDVPAGYLEYWVDQTNTEFTRQLSRYVRSSYFNEQHRARDAPGDEYEPEE